MDTYAADVAELTKSLDLKNAVHIGHSTGGGEVIRYAAKYGKGRIAKAVLISAVTPIMAQNENNPEGIPLSILMRYGLALQHNDHNISRISRKHSLDITERVQKCRRALRITGGARV